MKGILILHVTNSFTQEVNVFYEQGGVAIDQCEREKERTA